MDTKVKLVCAKIAIMRNMYFYLKEAGILLPYMKFMLPGKDQKHITLVKRSRNAVSFHVTELFGARGINFADRMQGGQ